MNDNKSLLFLFQHSTLAFSGFHPHDLSSQNFQLILNLSPNNVLVKQKSVKSKQFGQIVKHRQIRVVIDVLVRTLFQRLGCHHADNLHGLGICRTNNLNNKLTLNNSKCEQLTDQLKTYLIEDAIWKTIHSLSVRSAFAETSRQMRYSWSHHTAGHSAPICSTITQKSAQNECQKNGETFWVKIFPHATLISLSIFHWPQFVEANRVFYAQSWISLIQFVC